ncbi:phosphatase YbhA [Shigella sonnei 3226-85]|nr:phosphatase YbhA [Shigella sonnei 3226-85]EIQ54374.1 phosphatase YbhA [Shigella sonnei 4822-66]
MYHSRRRKFLNDAVKARANIVIGDNTTDSIAQFIYSHLI